MKAKGIIPEFVSEVKGFLAEEEGLKFAWPMS
jgi:hypothetical protein